MQVHRVAGSVCQSSFGCLSLENIEAHTPFVRQALLELKIRSLRVKASHGIACDSLCLISVSVRVWCSVIHLPCAALFIVLGITHCDLVSRCYFAEDFLTTVVVLPYDLTVDSAELIIVVLYATNKILISNWARRCSSYRILDLKVTLIDSIFNEIRYHYYEIDHEFGKCIVIEIFHYRILSSLAIKCQQVSFVFLWLLHSSEFSG